MESCPENNASGNIAVRTCDMIWCQSERTLCFKMKTSQRACFSVLVSVSPSSIQEVFCQSATGGVSMLKMDACFYKHAKSVSPAPWC